MAHFCKFVPQRGIAAPPHVAPPGQDYCPNHMRLMTQRISRQVKQQAERNELQRKKNLEAKKAMIASLHQSRAINVELDEAERVIDEQLRRLQGVNSSNLPPSRKTSSSRKSKENYFRTRNSLHKATKPEQLSESDSDSDSGSASGSSDSSSGSDYYYPYDSDDDRDHNLPDASDVYNHLYKEVPVSYESDDASDRSRSPSPSPKRSRSSSKHPSAHSSVHSSRKSSRHPSPPRSHHSSAHASRKSSRHPSPPRSHHSSAHPSRKSSRHPSPPPPPRRKPGRPRRSDTSSNVPPDIGDVISQLADQLSSGMQIN